MDEKKMKPALHKEAAKEGWWYEIMPLTFDRARIVLTDGGYVEDGW
jgi:hypothetical protein